MKTLLSIMSVYALLLTTILAIPFFNIFIAIIYCNSKSDIDQNITCYKGIYFLHFGAAILGLVIYLIFVFCFTFLYIDINPNS